MPHPNPYPTHKGNPHSPSPWAQQWQTSPEPMYTPFKKQLKRLSLPPWETLHDSVKLSLLLGSSLPLQMDKRKATQERWQLCTGNYCALVALKLSSTLNSLSIRSPVTQPEGAHPIPIKSHPNAITFRAYCSSSLMNWR